MLLLSCRLDLPTDLQEADEEISAPECFPGTQLWFLQLPAEVSFSCSAYACLHWNLVPMQLVPMQLDITEDMTFDVKSMPDGRLTATCEDDEGKT